MKQEPTHYWAGKSFSGIVISVKDSLLQIKDWDNNLITIVIPEGMDMQFLPPTDNPMKT